MASSKHKLRVSPWTGWAPLLLLPTLVLVGTPTGWPRWLWMWLLAGSIFAGCKWLTWRRTPVHGVSLWRYVGYLLAWPGLDARAFLSSEPLPASDRPSHREWLLAASRLLLGILLVCCFPRCLDGNEVLFPGWLGMVGVVLMLHCGLFHLLSCVWRAFGVDARPLMNRPLHSISLSEFWGRRWNTAFRDFTHRFLFRPLAAHYGPRVAMVLTFLFSGLVHDVVISIPAGAGYGGPTLFFLVQAGALLVERSRAGGTLGLGRGWIGRIFAGLMLLGPVYWLFHPAFIRNIVLPFLAALGGFPSCANGYPL